MTFHSNKQQSITFSPGLHSNDACANYWIRQITFRLRREICWCWNERGLLPRSESTVLPPFVDKIPAILDMNRFWEEKNKFYQTDPTATYLTEQLKASPPSIDQNSTQGSFGWVVSRLDLDDISSFVLALGLAVSFDNAVGNVVASCLNDPLKNHPNIALAQKLWDYPEKILILADPANVLF